jgi:anti-sigma B factor antagonist
MKATNRTVDGVEIIALQGKITIGSGDTQLREVIADAVSKGKTNILLDLSGVTTIDSSGIGELVGSYTTVTNRGGKLKLLHLPAKLNELLHVTQLITVFEVYENEGEAIASLQPAG